MSEFNISEITSQKGRTAIITGANTGLGFETTRALAATGMKVIMACRDLHKAQTAMNLILKEHPDSDIEIMLIDLSKLSSVREFAGYFLNRYDKLDLLINNAGIMIPPYNKTIDGFESQMGVNYFAHFLLTGLLFETIAKTNGSRIVTLASNAHKRATINFEDINWERGYSRMKAYGQSKLACLIFAIELDRRIKKAGIGTISVAAHPGVSVTELIRNVPAILMMISRPLTAVLTHSPEKGAKSILHAALADDVKGGEYFGPQGIAEWTGKPGRAKITPLANDESTALRLWEVSEKLTGQKFTIKASEFVTY
jgi:NAD(P)-dependent dehydrogenase (short-subunit alcohol dehydrogenase family)